MIVPPEKRERGKTFDDEALPFSLKSPAKLFAIQEQRNFGHSRSHSDLKLKEKAHYEPTTPPKQNEELSKPSPQRPGLGKVPRKSFMEPSIQGAKLRQEKLDDAVSRHIADVFFSVHVAGLEGEFAFFGSG